MDYSPTLLTIRPEMVADYNSITALHTLAFGQPTEANLVIGLRAQPEFREELSLVAAIGDEVFGHLLLSELHVTPNSVGSMLALAPVAVLPDFQGKGIGSALIERSIEWAREQAYAAMIVLGEPAYYQRFGFQHEPVAHIQSAYQCEAFMGLEFMPGSLVACQAVQYAEPFADLA